MLLSAHFVLCRSTANSQYDQVLSKFDAFRAAHNAFDQLNRLQSLRFFCLNLVNKVSHVSLRLYVVSYEDLNLLVLEAQIRHDVLFSIKLKNFLLASIHLLNNFFSITLHTD